MENTKTPQELIAELAMTATDNFTDARKEAARELRELIANATRELALFENNMGVTIDWVEQPAARYHDALVKANEAARMLSATEWALREVQS